MHHVGVLLLALHVLSTPHCAAPACVPYPARLQHNGSSTNNTTMPQWGSHLVSDNAQHSNDMAHHKIDATIPIVELKLKTHTGGPKKKMLVYVLCYDNSTCRTAHEHFDDFSWSVVLNLPHSIFFETYVFTYIFPDRIESDSWHEYEYVGTISWKAPLKFKEVFRFGPLNMTDVVDGAPPGVDVIALIGGKENMVNREIRRHPRFKELWSGLLEPFARFSPKEISTDGMTAFYCNYWLAKPEHVLRFIPFMKEAQRLLETLPSIQDALWSNTHYRDNPDLTQKVFGLDYYAHHPFVLERLAPFFFNVHKLSIYVYKWLGTMHPIKQARVPSKKKIEGNATLPKKGMRPKRQKNSLKESGQSALRERPHDRQHLNNL